MLQSNLFSKTRREDPKDEVSKNAKLLIRAGYINKEMAGVYSFLPLGIRVLNKIVQIIREEMEAIGSQELSMTALQNLDVWKQTGRDNDEVVDVWFKTKLKDGADLGLGFTHEEPITQMLKNHISSYRDLPVLIYQFQTKFRNETRAKSGLIRGREFLMKDLYSFHKNEEDHQKFYDQVRVAYQKIFDRLGLGEKTFVTLASGGTFSKSSDEFQTLCDAGEDQIFVSKEKKLAINKEVCTDELLRENGIERDSLEELKAVEVGNIFHLGTKFSAPLGLNYVDENGNSIPVIMGSYGLGPSRLMGTIAEVLSDEKGLVWPKSVAPFDAHLTALGYENEDVKKAVSRFSDLCKEKNIDLLIDDRETSAGDKFSDADLLGIPYRLVISPKTIVEGKIEVKNRLTGETRMLTDKELLTELS